VGLADQLRQVSRPPEVVVPWTNLAPETKAALEADGIDARYVDVSADHRDYWRLLSDVWAAAETTIIVEHDIVVPPGMVQALWDCPKDWCSAPYAMGQIEGTALGCTKFSGALMKRQRTALSRIPVEHRRWQALDSILTGTLRRNGEAEHIHGPAVRHLHYDNGVVVPDRAALRERNRSLTKLRRIEPTGRYLTGIPASDFETDDPIVIAQCLESGLYSEDGSNA